MRNSKNHIILIVFIPIIAFIINTFNAFIITFYIQNFGFPTLGDSIINILLKIGLPKDLIYGYLIPTIGITSLLFVSGIISFVFGIFNHKWQKSFAIFFLLCTVFIQSMVDLYYFSKSFRPEIEYMGNIDDIISYIIIFILGILMWLFGSFLNKNYRYKHQI